ncbi:hypothetical protein [Clostridium perfringens]|uniref:DUF7852 domain-containing protein n=1 Tax=Clostridium perfringens TaxID=1502 RepID=UPI00016BD7B3|nr:hypothetical protein [Clostridium perfringens]STB11607.1 Uncharacterised protein [Clostridium novyi]EDT79197.1 conserved hypothetical protein [Clostridium perfringens NCTC 8239]EHA0992540.1 hypothetical protein [Clostridium perfringens]EHA1004447.1 hypothetical protein [Clostridium perfringens]EHA1007427.1 hypothetical protein [Clostridium perfringens]
MSSCCERRFPVCADDIDVNVDNFNTTALPLTPNPTTNAKVLVRVATVNINHALTDSIVIPEGFYSIKGISRRLVLTQCYIVPTAVEAPDNAQLFVEGYILKNVQYATPSADQNPADPCEDCIVMRNDYRDLTAKINFNFSVPIDLDANIVTPVTETERAILKDCMKPCDKGTMSESDCERLFSQEVVLQEPFSCELDRYTINEAVISKTNCSLTNEDLFDTVVEKLNLNLVISIFQLRPVTVEVPDDTPTEVE